jgi:ABC-type bacteriocin/lantibiotic exporter with double-glycine peptidase domain
MKPFPHSTQLDAMDCGATCLRMIAKYYGRSYSNQFLREKSFITRSGVSLLGISEAAESIGGCTDDRNKSENVCIPAKSTLEDFLDIRYEIRNRQMNEKTN